MTDTRHVLIVEDDERLAELTREYLSNHGFSVSVVHNGREAVFAIRNEAPDLVLLDLMLPDKDGLDICKEARGFYRGPILILTAREGDMDQVAGLEMGADDYVAKPVLPRVLLARIRALLRRLGPSHSQSTVTRPAPIFLGSLVVMPTAREVILGGIPIDLTTTEYDLLEILVRNAGEILDRDTLYLQLKGVDYDGLDRSIDMAVSRLRKKLGDNPKHPERIKTVWGKGYLLVREAW